MIQIIPAVLATSEEQYSKDLQKLSSCEALKGGWVHIDFADNKFVQNKTVGIDTIAKFPTDFSKEAHLMVDHPLSSWLTELEKLDFSRIIIHVESDSQEHIRDYIRYLKDKNIEAGLAINPDSDVARALPFKSHIAVLQIMGVYPGHQGQTFIAETADRVEKAARLFNGNNGLKIAVDGGVNLKNAKLLVEKGAEVLIVGSYLLKGNIDENLEKLWEILYE